MRTAAVIAAALLAGIATLSCSGQDRPAVSDPTPPQLTKLAAEIGEAFVHAVGDPPRHVAVVVSIQPDSCEEFAGHISTQTGMEVRIEVSNIRFVSPSDDCTGPVRETRSEIPIELELMPGVEYTLTVNGASQNFTISAEQASDSSNPLAPEPTPQGAPIGPVRVERITVFLDETPVGYLASFQALAVTESEEPAVGVTVQASLQGPVGTEMLASMVGEVETDENGIATFTFELEHGGSYLFLVELVFGLGAVLDRGASDELDVILDVPES